MTALFSAADAAIVAEPSIRGAVAITKSDTVTIAPARQFAVICTIAGEVKVGFIDGSTMIFPVVEGLSLLPWAVIQVYSTGTSASATFYNLG